MGGLVTGDALVAAIRRAVASGPRAVAVAFVGRGDLPNIAGKLTRGDLVVCDASERALASGATCPGALREMLKRGVEVWTVKGMHAKVYVGADSAVACSANLSGNALGGATYGSIEAGVVLGSRSAVAQAKRFVEDLRAKDGALRVTASYLDFADSIYVPPRTAPRPRSTRGLNVVRCGGTATAKQADFAIEHVPNVGLYEDGLLEPLFSNYRSREGSRAVMVWAERGIPKDDWEVWAPAECIKVIPYRSQGATWVEYWLAQSNVVLTWRELRERVAAATGYVLQMGHQVRRADVIDVVERLFRELGPDAAKPHASHGIAL